ncbi:MAG TPA: AAA family ATPase [Trebonia sp.]
MSSSPIRGRDEHLDLLAGFLQSVGAGAGGVVIIEGDAGLGKTRLLTAARETARALEFRTGLGTAAGHTNRGIADRLFVSPHTVTPTYAMSSASCTSRPG